MTNPTPQQIIQFNTLLSRLKIFALKRDIINEATGGRTNSTMLMSKQELAGVITNLYEKQKQTSFKAGNNKRRRILSLCHQLPPHLAFTYWSEPKQQRLVDMDKLNNWLIVKGTYNKKLNDHSPIELSKVIVQFENMLKGYLKQG